MKIIKLTENISNLDTSAYAEDDKFLVFDIDGTLYKENKELVSKRRLAQWKHLNRDLNISFDEFESKSKIYTKKYGTNYKGFLKDYKIGEDLIKNIDNVYGEISDHLTDPSASIELLKNLSNSQKRVRIFCFSNSTSKQSEYTLNILNISKYVDTLFCTGYCTKNEIITKPMVEAFDYVNKVVQNNGDKKILFFDDNDMNIESAKKSGWIAIKVDDADNINNIVEREIKNHFG
ncbi:suppressor of disruption of TFIIS (SDT1) [Vairimorpha necatrix]|uniref:Suppressor of disruption of TFIIS (SDT1) n=1 Tax=Vairimorpha necatrix TaxID=6039 RepID=A0AAX4JCA4_9MICR